MAQDNMNSSEDAGCATEGPVLCARNCGFFGTAATLNMCSRCYKTHLAQQPGAAAGATIRIPEKEAIAKTGEQTAILKTDTQTIKPSLQGSGAAKPVPPKPTPRDATGEANVGIGQGGGSSSEGETPKEDSGPKRCHSCKKKVGLTGFKCRCGYIFCATHRYSDKHSCTFDYKTAGRDAIAQANPVVKADKIEKV